MYTYKVELTYQTFYVPADDYSVTQDRYLFWIGKRIVRSFIKSEVVNVTRLTEVA